MIYIYGLMCPDAGYIRYIGKSISPNTRFQSHVTRAKDHKYKHRTALWIRGLLSRGLLPSLVLLEELGEGSDWQASEKKWIASAPDRGWNLTNSTTGGQGLSLVGEEEKARYSAVMSASMKEAYKDPKIRKVIRERMTAKWRDTEFAEKRRRKLSSLETRAKMSISANLANADPDKKSAKMKAIRSSNYRDLRSKISYITSSYPEVKARIGAESKARWADPESREKLCESLRKAWTPARRQQQAERIRNRGQEYKSMMSERAKKAWADPEKRQRMVSGMSGK